MKINIFKRSLVAAFIVIFSIPAVSFAQYQPQTESQQIAYLYGVIAQLQAQLAALQAAQPHPTTPTYYYTPSSQSSSNEVTAITGSVHTSSGEVMLEGQIDFDASDRVRAWFEYGTNQSVTQSTQSVDITGSSNTIKSIAISASVISSYSTYQYRLVVEDGDGDFSEGILKSFTVSNYTNDIDDNDNDSDSNDEDTPDVTTDNADNIDYDRAELQGDVDMNDFEDGLVFFVYGEDEDDVNDVEDENEYSDIDTNGDDLQKVLIDSDLDSDDSYEYTVLGLDEDHDYYFRICVEYEDEDNDTTLMCGDIEDFTTDNN